MIEPDPSTPPHPNPLPASGERESRAANENQSPLLQIRGLSKAFGSVVAADGIGLDVAQGEALGIIGPNGAGKTTLFSLIAGSIRPDRGTIRLDGRDLAHLPQHARCAAGIGRTHQIPHPFANLTVFENLLVAAVHGSGRSERDAADFCAGILKTTSLLPQANRLSGSLPLLARKRLELARALATGPELLLLDETAGGLTEAECGALVETIAAIRAGGVTVIWIEHVVHALLAVIERLIVLDFGRKIAEGEPRAVMASPEVRAIYMGIAAGAAEAGT